MVNDQDQRVERRRITAGYSLVILSVILLMLRIKIDTRERQQQIDDLHQQTIKRMKEFGKHDAERRKIFSPRFDDYPAISDTEFQAISGQWEVMQSWDLGLCLYSKKRDERRGFSFRYGVEIERNLIRYGQIEMPLPTPVPVDDRGRTLGPSESFSISTIWGSHGSGTFSGQVLWDSPGSSKSAAVSLQRGTADRGLYLLDRDTLWIYWIAGYEKEAPLPDGIPLRPHDMWSRMLVLKRFPPGSLPVKVLHTNKSVPLDRPSAIQSPRSKVIKSGEIFAPTTDELLNQPAPGVVRDALREMIQELKEP